mgnify:CR=1 FL=1
MVWSDMSKMLNVLALLILGGLVGVVGWWTNHYRSSLLEHERGIAAREERIADLNADLELQLADLREVEVELRIVNEENNELELRNRLLRLDHRLARVEVVGQEEAQLRRQLEQQQLVLLLLQHLQFLLQILD